jgi:hypothetical protein
MKDKEEYSEVEHGIIYGHPLQLHYDNKYESNIHRLYRIAQIKTFSVLIYAYMAIALVIVILCTPIILIKSREVYGNVVSPVVELICKFDVWRKYRYTVKEWCNETGFSTKRYYARREEHEAEGRTCYQDIY